MKWDVESWSRTKQSCQWGRELGELGPWHSGCHPPAEGWTLVSVGGMVMPPFPPGSQAPRCLICTSLGGAWLSEGDSPSFGDPRHCPVLMPQAGTVGPGALWPPAQPAISRGDAPFPGSLCSAPRQDLSLSRGWMPPTLQGASSRSEPGFQVALPFSILQDKVVLERIRVLLGT